MKQVLKDGTEIESIPIGKSSIIIGEVSPDGMLTVCDRAPANSNLKNRGARVICRCKCGNYTTVNITAFRRGDIKSCGCYNIEIHKETCKEIGQKSNYKDYTKIKNPYYKFIKRLDKKDNSNSSYWEVECKKCGKRYEAVPVQLISDTRRKGSNPCDCYRFLSKGVIKIENILKENNIYYEKEKTFSDCLSPIGHQLKFDFYINNKYLLEYDGEQHFQPQTFGNTALTKEEIFIKIKEHDEIKNQYCINNNLILIRIPYTIYDKITIDDLIPETSKYLIQGENNE